MPQRYLSAEGMRNWARLKKLENERHDLEKKIIELTKRLKDVEEEIHKLGGI
jgi:prefoldin subunit 5